MTIEIQSLRQTELPSALTLHASVGSNPGLSDLRVLLACDPDCVLAIRQDDRLLGFITVVRYPWFNAFVSIPVVAVEAQGRGLEKQLLSTALKRLAGYNVGADVPKAYLSLFEGAGFSEHLSVTMHTGILTPPEEMIPGIVPSAGVNHGSLAAYDTTSFCRERGALLKQWCAAPGAICVCAVSGSVVVGYAVARPLKRGMGIGPLFANDERTARKLIQSVADEIPLNSAIHCCVPSSNPSAASLVSSLGLVQGERYTRMFTDFNPVPDYSRWFFTASAEIG